METLFFYDTRNGVPGIDPFMAASSTAGTAEGGRLAILSILRTALHIAENSGPPIAAGAMFNGDDGKVYEMDALKKAGKA